MEFRDGGYGTFNIKLKGEWYGLCACRNCKRVHATHPNIESISSSLLLIADKKIRCCNNPDNHTVMFGTENIIKAFVEKWRD